MTSFLKITRTLFIGLGGTGVKSLLSTKKLYIDKYGDVPPMVAFLAIDTDEGIRNVPFPVSILGISYNEINIIVYFLLIPLTWTIMLDVCLGTPITSIAFLFIWIGIRIGTWGRFSEWCDWIFKESVDFLKFFNNGEGIIS